MAKALGKDSLSLFLVNKERANEDAMAPQRPRRKRALITGRNWERYRYQCQDVRSRDKCHGEWQIHLKELPTKAMEVMVCQNQYLEMSGPIVSCGGSAGGHGKCTQVPSPSLDISTLAIFARATLFGKP